MKLYKQLNTIKIDISHSTIDETAEKIYFPYNKGYIKAGNKHVYKKRDF